MISTMRAAGSARSKTRVPSAAWKASTSVVPQAAQ
jgi:hypothetical protein